MLTERLARFVIETRTADFPPVVIVGVCAHALDFDDSLTTLHGHPSAAVPAAGKSAAREPQSTG